MSIDQLLYELGPLFCKYKLENVASFSLNTNSDSNTIDLIIYKLDTFSHEKVAFIIDCFNAVVRSFSSNLEEFTYCISNIVQVQGETHFYRYTFTTKNLSDQDLARKDIYLITAI